MQSVQIMALLQPFFSLEQGSTNAMHMPYQPQYPWMQPIQQQVQRLGTMNLDFKATVVRPLFLLILVRLRKCARGLNRANRRL
jgi:hypothetical protein